ncbi:mannose-1-phosphate guanylyltransferase [Namhaeicola litoreus]|uniref:Mannose-1-phosphate guanylyltransferase n=1 Tax=Namhaeicola litoreus TaxID=1052145 RepID=A0ABW3Y4L3_9FLAO
MNKNYYALIMAGGIGSRFWPVSTKENPKQFHDMLGTGRSLLQQTFDRLSKIIPAENILIATNKMYTALVKEHLPQIKDGQILAEPAMRNTAPCILYSALKIKSLNKDAVMIVAPSDHHIENEETFASNVITAFKACEENDILMTLGIEPSNPNTGYGYIRFENSKNEIKKVINFTEKPDLETAKEFIKQGDYLWNAGIFVWSVESVLTAFEVSLPKMYKLFEKGNSLYNSSKEESFIEQNYGLAENVSIDYGIMESAKNVFVLPVDFGWNDLGTWGALYDKLEKDQSENAVVNARVYAENAAKNMISTASGKKVVVKGLDNYIIVDTENTLLILPKENEQDIKEISAKVNQTK